MSFHHHIIVCLDASEVGGHGGLIGFDQKGLKYQGVTNTPRAPLWGRAKQRKETRDCYWQCWRWGTVAADAAESLSEGLEKKQKRRRSKS
jgi:hypothetical protein